MVLTRRLLSVMLLAVAATGCARDADRTVVLQREWFANAEYAGDEMARVIADSLGRVRLDVREGAETIDPIAQVRSGLADFGVASADRVLRENEAGADLVILGAATRTSPVVFLSPAGEPVSGASSLRGKTVGIQGGTATDILFRALLDELGLSPGEVEIVEPGWGTQPLEAGLVDVLGAFAYDEPVTLQQNGFAFAELKPKEHGVDFVGTVYFTRRDLAETEPEVVQSVVRSLLDGWLAVSRDQASAMKVLHDRYDITLEKERESLARGMEYFVGPDIRPLYADSTRFRRIAETLIRLGELRGPVAELSSAVDLRFLERAETDLRDEHN